MASSHTFLPDVSNLTIEKHALTVQSFGEPLIATMNKYTRGNVRYEPNAPGVVLLLAHGLGFLKEMWEPVIEDIFRLDDSAHANSLATSIREVWSLDCPNHGEAGVRNENVFVRSPDRLMIWDYSEAFVELYKSGLLGQLDPRKHRVVLCGHSAGAISVVFATSFFDPSSRVPFSSLILVDPPIWSKKWHGKDNDFYKAVEQMTPIRRDIWNSKAEATEWLRKKVARAWDQRVFAKYIEHGLRRLPTAFYPDSRAATLTTHRLAENFCLGEAAQFRMYEALDRLNQICVYVPVHLVYGNKNDMFDRELQDSLISPEDGRAFASVRRVNGAGHLVPQEKPTVLAEEIFDILQSQNIKLSQKL